MDDLVRWLGEQLDEDERIARACSGAPWEIEIPPMVHVSVKARRDNKWKWGRLGYVATVERDEDRAHIAAHDPARVLREIDAKRWQLEVLAESLRPNSATGIPRGVAWSMLTRMAEVYRDRPGWQSYWPGSG